MDTLKAVIANTLRSRANFGDHYPPGTAKAMLEAAAGQVGAWAIIEAMERVLREAKRA
jgi:hypothetical protein